jgi:hypothetical protein
MSRIKQAANVIPKRDECSLSGSEDDVLDSVPGDCNERICPLPSLQYLSPTLYFRTKIDIRRRYQEAQIKKLPSTGDIMG